MDEIQELKLKVESLEKRIEKLESTTETQKTRRYTPSISPRIPSQQLKPIVEHESPKTMLQKHGKGLLAIVASILIFIGLITFATLIFDKLGIWGQVSFMYIFSIALYALGIFMFTKKGNIFSLSLWGCGVGAIYISLFSTRLYFNLFTDIGMYCSLAVWSLIIFLIYHRIQNNLPINIASIAISLSVIFGAFNANSINEFNFIAIYFIALVGGFTFLMGARKMISPNIFMCITSFMALMVYLANFFQFISDANAFPLSFLCWGFSIYLPFQMRDCIENMANTGISLRVLYKFFVTPIVMSMLCITKMFVLEGVPTFLFLGMLTSLILFTFVVFEECYFPDYYTNIIRFFSILGIVYLFSEKCQLDVLIPILAVFMVYFIYNRDTDGIGITAIISIITMAFIIPGSYGASIYSGLIGLLFALATIIATFFKFRKWENPSRALKNLLLGLLVVASVCCGIGIAEGTKYCYTLGTLMGTIPLAVSQIGVLRNNWVTLDVDKKQEGLFSVLAFIAMLVDIRMAISHEFTTLAMGLAILTFALNPKVKSLDNARGQILGIQFTVLCMGMLSVFVKNSEMPFLFTLTGILCAAICIYIGFKFSNKSFRGVGVGILSISIIKLLLFDIQYGSPIGTAAGFICAGLLCFGIVWIYGKFEKDKKKD